MSNFLKQIKSTIKTQLDEKEIPKFVSKMKAQFEEKGLDKVQLNLWYYVTQYSLLDQDIAQTKAFLAECYQLLDPDFDFTESQVIEQLIKNSQQFELEKVNTGVSLFKTEAKLFVPIFIRAYLRSSQSNNMFEQLCIYLKRLPINLTINELMIQVMIVDAILYGFKAEDYDEDSVNADVISLSKRFIENILNGKSGLEGEPLEQAVAERTKNYFILPADDLTTI